MSDLHIPDLNFPVSDLGKPWTPCNIRALLYRGGAATDVRQVTQLILENAFGPFIGERLPLITRLHAILAGALVAGISPYTVRSKFASIRIFYSWMDKAGRSPTVSSAEADFLDWTDYLLHQHRVGELKLPYIYNCACAAASVLDEALDLKIGMLRKTRIPLPKKQKVLSAKEDKQNLTEIFTFGHALLDISDQLTVEKIQGKLPAPIHFRTGQVVELWSGLIPADRLKTLTNTTQNSWSKKQTLKTRTAWEADTSRRTRFPLINLRIEAEMLIFIAQTGMNLAQAYKLKMGRFSYQSHTDGYQVRRVYKKRRQGEVEFYIYSEYRLIFERYLSWHRAIFQDDENGFLFPLSPPQGRPLDVAPNFQAIRQLCTAKLNILYFGPRMLRKIRVNWLIRRSLDPALTAEMSQHTEETLLQQYNQPHHQVAIIEISRFHTLNDPTFAPPGPGCCVEATPTVMPNIPDDVPRPDCVSPAGCLFCSHQRDIDSAEHIWSLTSYRYYKSLELAMYRQPIKATSVRHPAATVIDRITEKLKFFKESSRARALWVAEATARIEEGHFHPKWEGFIKIIEAST